MYIVYYLLFFVVSHTANFERCSKSSDFYLVALSRDICERHTIYRSIEPSFSFKMMLISSRYLLFYSNNILYIIHSIPLTCFDVIEL